MNNVRDKKGRFKTGHKFKREISPKNICSNCGLFISYCKELCKKCYHKRYREDRPELKNKDAQRLKEWKIKNPEKLKKGRREWRLKNPAYHKKYIENHKEEDRIYHKRSKEKYPEKVKARQHANDRKQKGNKCEECCKKNKLEFHHTNYLTDEGITLCKECHIKKHP